MTKEHSDSYNEFLNGQNLLVTEFPTISAKWKPNVLEFEKGFLKFFRDYLGVPIIEDSFESNHGDRIKWREELSPDKRTWYENNKLRWNKISGLKVLIVVLEEEKSNLFKSGVGKKLKSFLDGVKEAYDYKILNNKTLWVKELDSIIRDFINSLTIKT